MPALLAGRQDRLVAVRDRASVIVGTTAPCRAAAQLVFLLALSVSLWRLTLPNVLTGAGGYDDGVYMAAAARLVQGHLPYRDFTFLHPPGLPVLMSPVAALGELIGARHAFAAARVLTAVVGAANAALIGYALRSRGPGAVLVAGLAFAVFPLAVSGSGTLTLEPYVLLFALIGTCLLLSTRQRASGTRLVWAGAAFGFACSVKLSGALVVLAAGLVCLVFARRALPRLAVGFGMGLGLTCLPFLAAAPAAFVHDVVLVQLRRGIEARYALPVADRLLDILGLRATSNPDPRWALTTLAVLVALIVVGVALNRGRLLPVEWFALSASALTAAAVLRAPQFYTYYGYYPSAFACMVLGVLCATYGRFTLEHVLAHSRPGTIVLRSAAYAALAGSVLLILPVTTR